MALAPGTRIGSYEILAPLGAGGMGEVYRARGGTLAREVAIKVLPERVAFDPEMRARFEREAQTVARLSHPNILAIHDFGADHGVLYAVTELLQGETLREQLDRSPVPWRRALEIGAEIAEGLAAAHEMGVVHRDLKPSNLFLTKDGRVKILDFGLAQLAPTAGPEEPTLPRNLTEPGVTLGTVGYMSPEQVRGSGVDSRTDLFSLGAVLYEMLAGRQPFTRPTAADTLAAILNDEPADPRDGGEAVPADVVALVSRCLAKDSAKRFQSARDLAFALSALASGPGGSTNRGDRKDRRRPTALGVASLLAVVAGIGVFWTVSRDRGRATTNSNPRTVLVLPFQNETREPALDSLSTLAADWIGQGLARTEIVDVVPRGAERTAEEAAGTIVSGAYNLEGEALQFRANVTSADGKLLFATDPVRGSRESPTELVERLRERVMSQLAIHFDPRMRCLKYTRLPSFDAIREYVAGLDLLFKDNSRATLHFERSIQLDPGFLLPRLGRADVFIAQAQRAEALSAIELLSDVRGEFTPYERSLVDFYTAELKGNLGESVRTIRLAKKIAPDDFLATYCLGTNALALNRPRETVDTLSSFDVSVYSEWFFAASLFSRLTEARHLLGEYELEIAEGRRGRELFPELPFLRLPEVRALAAMGRLSEMNKLIEETLVMTSSDFAPGDVLREAVLELGAHGQEEAARQLADRAVSWYQSRIETPDAADRADYGDAMYVARKWEEAEAVFRGLLAENESSIDSKGYLACLAARRGDRALAREIDRELEKTSGPFLYGRQTYWRASIAAFLGEKARAVELLQQAYSQGLRYDVHLHRDPAFESLRADPSFQELLRPKG